MRVLVVLMALVLLLVSVGGVAVLAAPEGASVAPTERMTTNCPAFDLTGRPVVNVIFAVGETRCVYKRPAETAECPTNAPTGWTVVGLIDAPRNKDKVTCIYQNVTVAE